MRPPAASFLATIALLTACSTWREIPAHHLRSHSSTLAGEQLRVTYPARTLVLTEGRLEAAYLSGFDAMGNLQRLDISPAALERRGADFRARFPALAYELEASAFRGMYVRGRDRSGNTLILDLGAATAVEKYQSSAAALSAGLISITLITLAVVVGIWILDPFHIGA